MERETEWSSRTNVAEKKKRHRTGMIERKKENK